MYFSPVSSRHLLSVCWILSGSILSVDVLSVGVWSISSLHVIYVDPNIFTQISLRISVGRHLATSAEIKYLAVTFRELRNRGLRKFWTITNVKVRVFRFTVNLPIVGTLSTQWITIFENVPWTVYRKLEGHCVCYSDTLSYLVGSKTCLFVYWWPCC